MPHWVNKTTLPKLKQKAIKLYKKGTRICEICRILKKSRQTIMTWVSKRYHKLAIAQKRRWVNPKLKDPLYRLKMNKRVAENNMKRYYQCKQFRIKMNDYSRKWRKNNKLQAQTREWIYRRIGATRV